MEAFRIKPKVYHKAAKINARGDVSALCFSTPHAINLAKASWVLEDKRVTCPKCKKLMAASPSSTQGATPERNEIERG